MFSGASDSAKQIYINKTGQSSWGQSKFSKSIQLSISNSKPLRNDLLYRRVNANEASRCKQGRSMQMRWVNANEAGQCK